VEWDELSSISRFRNEFHNLTIEVDDTSLPGDERSEMNDKLQDMAFQIVQTNICRRSSRRLSRMSVRRSKTRTP